MKFIKYFVLLFMLISSSFFCFACDSNKDSDNSDTSNSNEKIKVNLFYFDMENPDRELEYSKGSTIIIDENENSQFIRYIRQDDDSPSSEGKYIFAGWYDNSDFLGDRIKD